MCLNSWTGVRSRDECVFVVWVQVICAFTCDLRSSAALIHHASKLKPYTSVCQGCHDINSLESSTSRETFCWRVVFYHFQKTFMHFTHSWYFLIDKLNFMHSLFSVLTRCRMHWHTLVESLFKKLFRGFLSLFWQCRADVLKTEERDWLKTTQTWELNSGFCEHLSVYMTWVIIKKTVIFWLKK